MLSNEKGYALPIVLIVMIVLVVLSTVLWNFSSAETVQVGMGESRAKAHYLARSGLSVTERVIEDRIYMLIDEDEKDVFIYGSLEKESNPFNWELKYGVYNGEHDDEDIVIIIGWEKIEADNVEYGVEGTIISRGYYLGVEEKIVRDFKLLEVVDGKNLGWVMNVGANKGRLKPGQSYEWDSPVSFSGDDGDGVYVQDASVGTLSAPYMAFNDKPDSLINKHSNSEVDLAVNHISFQGNIVFEKEGKFYINTRDAEVFTRNDLEHGLELGYLQLLADDEIEYDNYGLLHLDVGADIKDSNGDPVYKDETWADKFDTGTESYYFIPELPNKGLDLSDPDYLGKLIKINDIEQFDVSILSIGLVFMSYR